MSPKEGPRPWRRVVVPRLASGALLAALLGMVLLLHCGVGPDLGEGGGWLAPRGFLLGLLGDLGVAERPAAAVALLEAPALALAVAVFLTTRSALGRWLALSALVAVPCVAFYGLAFPIPWRLFAWRWSATLALFSLSVGGALAAVLLTASWRRRAWPARLALYAPIFFLLAAFERNVTGTDPSLPFALSPWPAVQVFGLELVGTSTAFILLGVALALFCLARLPGRTGWGGAVVVGLVLAAAAPALALGVGSRTGLLPGETGVRTIALAAGISLVVLAAAAVRLGGQPARLGQRARLFGLSALLLGAPLLSGELLTRLDYAITRDDRAQQLIDALDVYFEGEDEYPESLGELVDAGLLDAVPRPRIGFGFLSDQEFGYQSFGISYILEFSAPRWIQCAYTPPYEEEETGEDDGETLSGAWSCPPKPPELW